MVKKPIHLIYFQLIIICFLIDPSLGYGQLLDLDYAKQKREERRERQNDGNGEIKSEQDY